MNASSPAPLDLRQFQQDVTSQHGENGIIAAIFERIGETNRRCVEFGAYSLGEDSNVYPLWRSSGWEAVLIEGDGRRAEKIRKDYGAMLASSDPPSGKVIILNQFVEPVGPHSLDALLAELGWDGQIDLCVIDVDGMDYHIFAGMERTKPRVVVCEFNPTIPVHMSIVGSDRGNYLGCSAKALFDLARRKGYSLLACTRANCIFVRDELATGFHLCNDLDALFNDHAVTYLMNAYDGAVFLSRAPVFRSNFFSSRARRDLGAHADELWVPYEQLGAGYAFARMSFSALNSVAPWLAEGAMRTLRAIRRKTGANWLSPPSPMTPAKAGVEQAPAEPTQKQSEPPR